MPSRTGIRMSIRVTSGTQLARRPRPPSSPLAGLTDHLEVGLVGEQRAEPGPHHALVVDDRQSDAHASPPPAAGSRRAAPRHSDEGPRSTVPPYSATRSRMPTRPWPAVGVVGAPVRGRRPPPRRPAGSGAYRTSTCARVAWACRSGVGEALLGDPVRREVDARAERDRLTLDPEVPPAGHREPTWRTSRSSSPRPGWGARASGLVPLGAQHAEEPAHLRQRLARRRLDRGEVRCLGGVVGAEPAAYCLGLDGHHADRVGHDVVQLAGDPGAFLGGGAGRLVLALALELRRPGRPPRSALAVRPLQHDARRPTGRRRTRVPAARSLGSKRLDDRHDEERHHHEAEPEVVVRRARSPSRP